MKTLKCKECDAEVNENDVDVEVQSDVIDNCIIIDVFCPFCGEHWIHYTHGIKVDHDKVELLK